MKWIRSQRLKKRDWRSIRELREKCVLPGKREFLQLQEVIRHNPGLEEEDAVTQLCAMAVSMKRSGLKGSTISTTVRKAIGFQRSTWPFRTTREALRLAEQIESEDQDARKPAPECTRRQVKRICTSLKSIPLKVAIELMSNSPMRFCDIRATVFDRVSVGERFVEIKLQGGKTTKRRLTREKFRILRKKLSQTTIRYLVQGKEYAAMQPICSGSTQKMNDELKRNNVPATTYSFRNLWMKETIDENTNSKGVTDWSAVQRITLHRSIKALKSSYGFVFDESKA